MRNLCAICPDQQQPQHQGARLYLQPGELQQGCAIYPPGLLCQRRGDKNQFNLQNHPLDTKSKQLLRSRVRDVKGAGRDSLCLFASSMWLFPFLGSSPTPLLQSWRYKSQAGAQEKLPWPVFGKQLGAHWTSLCCSDTCGWVTGRKHGSSMPSPQMLLPHWN